MHERSSGLNHTQPYENNYAFPHNTAQRYATMNNIESHTNAWTLQQNTATDGQVAFVLHRGKQYFYVYLYYMRCTELYCKHLRCCRSVNQFNSLPHSFSTTESLDSQQSKKKGKFGTLGRIFSKKDKSRGVNGNNSSPAPPASASLPSSPPVARCK